MVLDVTDFDEVAHFFKDIERISHGELDVDYLRENFNKKILRIKAWKNGDQSHGAIAYYLVKRAKGLQAFVVMIGGRGVDMTDFDHFLELLRQDGVNHMQGLGSIGISRLWKRLGFKVKQLCFERDI